MQTSYKFFAALSLIVFVSTGCFAEDLLRLDVAEAQRGNDLPDSSVSPINLRLGDRSTEEFAIWTCSHIGKKMKIMIDGRVISEPRLLTCINGGALPLVGVPATEIDLLIPKLMSGESIVSVEIAD